jgi:flagellar hook-basal body complex protein FliE
MAHPVSTSRTAHAVVRRIDALEQYAAQIEARCVHQGDRSDLRETVIALGEARVWLQVASQVDPTLVSHVATMVNAACGRLYQVARNVG